MQRLNINRPSQASGHKPTWKFTAARGAMTQTGKASGTNAIQYRREVLILGLCLPQNDVGMTLSFKKTRPLLMHLIFSKPLYMIYTMFLGFSSLEIP
jgi:hypothetical protein